MPLRKALFFLAILFLFPAGRTEAKDPSPLPADEFLAALELPGTGAADPPLSGFAAEHGLVIRRLEVPAAAKISFPPRGADILRAELADTPVFHILSIRGGPVIAIFPVLTGRLSKELLKKTRYFDLTPFAVQTAGNTAEGWERARRQIREWRELIREYKRFLKLDEQIRPAYGDRHTYVQVTLDPVKGEVIFYPFDPSELGNRAGVKIDPKLASLTFPVLPTVYSPATDENRAADANFSAHVHRSLKQLALRNGDRLIDVGTGSGYLAWVAWVTAQSRGIEPELYALDINPVAVANAQILARLGGYRLQSKVSDNVADGSGRYAFPGTRFRAVIWNMPSVPPNMTAPPTLRGTLADYWDQGPNGLDVLKRFTASLRGMLDPEGVAIIWNIIPLNGVNIVEQTFRNAGFKTRLLDSYRDYDLTCVVYAVS